MPKKAPSSPGPKACKTVPVEEFAQVEFVATKARLFNSHRAEAVPDAGMEERMEEARERVMCVVRDSNVELLLKIKEPESVRVRWVER